MGLLDTLSNKYASMDEYQKKDLKLGLAEGFAGMTANPNAGQIIAGIQNQRKGIMDARKESSAADKLKSQRDMAVQMLGDKFPMLKQAVASGIISPNEAITAARKGGDVKVVGSSLVDTEGKVLFTDTSPKDDANTTAFRTLESRAAAAGLKKGTEAYQQFMLNGGTQEGLEVVVGADGSVKLSQGKSGSSSLTQGQADASGFWQRVKIANDNLQGLEDQGTKFGANILAALPFGVGNYAQTPEFQLYSQSQEDWINAVLRDESGAAIGPDEFLSAKSQYFPQVGDGPEVIAQKRANRKTKELGLWMKSGQDTTYPTGYNPPSSNGSESAKLTPVQQELKNRGLKY